MRPEYIGGNRILVTNDLGVYSVRLAEGDELAPPKEGKVIQIYESVNGDAFHVVREASIRACMGLGVDFEHLLD
jgi:hypothetical protein